MDLTDLEKGRCVILKNLPHFLTYTALKAKLEASWPVEKLRLIHRSDHVYTNCCLAVMKTKAGVDTILSNGLILMSGMKVMPVPYSSHNFEEVLTVGAICIPVAVPSEEGYIMDRVKFSEDLQVHFQDCNLTQIRLDREDDGYWRATVFVSTEEDRAKVEEKARALEHGEEHL